MNRLLIVLVLILLTASHLAAKFTPPANSPLARREHPRLFATATGIDNMRSRIQNYYNADFQQFVNDVDGIYNSAPDLGEWNLKFGAARSFALLCRVDPATIGGISAKHSKADYGRKAIELGLHLAQSLPNDWDEAHHGANNLTTGEGGIAALALQVVYDWTFDLATLEQRRDMADRLITMWDNRYSSEKVKLENHYAANVHVYGAALSFYGDEDLGASYTSKAQTMMDSFQDVFIERQLGVAALLYEGSSDWVEGDSYSMDGFIGIMFLAGAASSALNQNLFAENPWLHYAPWYIYFNIIPMPYQGEYYLTQHNTSSAITGRNRSTSSVMNMSAAMLYEEDPNLAGFAAWFCEKSAYGLIVDDYAYYEPFLFDFFYKFVFGTKHVTPKTPEEAGVPLSVHLGQAQTMRSDFSAQDATLIQFYSPKYWYANGHNEEEIGAFNLHRFGPLAISAVNTKNSGDIPRVDSDGKGMALNNIFGLGSDGELALEKGSIGDDDDTPQRFTEGAETHIGTVEAREHRPGLFDYVNYNYTRSYKAGNKASLARRALVYLRGPVNHEFVVVMDRVQSSQNKTFIMHTAGDLAAIGGEWSGAGSGHWTTSAKTVKLVNRIDRAHGQMYVTSVLPENATLHKFGGNGYEWVWADGSPLSYGSGFSELATYLLSDHTLQIRSTDNYFLTVMQIGDANTMGTQATVEKLSGSNWAGALIEGERVIIFGKTEDQLGNLSYTIQSNKSVEHLITELKPNRVWTASKGGVGVAGGSTGPNGTIAFEHNPGGSGTYDIVVGGIATTEVGETNSPPKEITLAAHPNPFQALSSANSATVTFSLPAEGAVTLAVYDLNGRIVRTLLSGTMTAGRHSITWEGTRSNGIHAASGVYLYRLETKDAVIQRKMMLVR